jgi:hypothetical protein
MASKIAIASTLKFMLELYPNRESISETTAEAWAFAFADWADEELRAAAAQAATTPGRSFFPTPGEIAACRKVTPIVDAARLLRDIERLGVNHPGGGYIAPQVWLVREKLGDVVADAYATAGGPPRCFSDEEITRSIAFREFQKAATTYAAMPASDRPLLGSDAGPRRIAPRGAPVESIAAVLTRALPAATGDKHDGGGA